MTPADLAQLDLAVDKALGKAHRAGSKCPECGTVWTVNYCCGKVFASGVTDIPSRAWSTSPEAVGEMMQWLAANAPDDCDPFVHRFYNAGGGPDYMWEAVYQGLSPEDEGLGCADTLPHALALAVCEVAKRKEALKP